MTVSVVLTCHNERSYIGEAIRSVAAQTAFAEVREILVVDDGSTDGSTEFVDSLSGEIPKLRCLRTGGVGVSAARNAAIKESSGEFVAFLDGDDIWHPEKIAIQLSLTKVDKAVALVYCDYYDFSKSDLSDREYVSVNRYTKDTLDLLQQYFVHDGPIIPSMMLVRRDTLVEVGLFDETVNMMEDTELCLRLAERYKFEHAEYALVYKRRHSANATRRLGCFVSFSVEQTDRFIARNPELRPLREQRIAYRFARIGNHMVRLGIGNRRNARTLILTAIRKEPLRTRFYVYALLALLPRSLSTHMRRFLKHLARPAAGRLPRRCVHAGGARAYARPGRGHRGNP